MDAIIFQWNTTSHEKKIQLKIFINRVILFIALLFRFNKKCKQKLLFQFLENLFKMTMVDVWRP